MKKAIDVTMIMMVVVMMATREIMSWLMAFVLQVWLNINWVWVGGGLFPITW